MPIPDELLDKLGEYYTSAYVAKNQPWVLKLSFQEFVQRHINRGGGEQGGLRYPSYTPAD